MGPNYFRLGLLFSMPFIYPFILLFETTSFPKGAGEINVHRVALFQIQTSVQKTGVHFLLLFRLSRPQGSGAHRGPENWLLLRVVTFTPCHFLGKTHLWRNGKFQIEKLFGDDWISGQKFRDRIRHTLQIIKIKLWGVLTF